MADTERFTTTAPLPASGTIELRVGGRVVSRVVARSDDSQSSIATRLAAREMEGIRAQSIVAASSPLIRAEMTALRWARRKALAPAATAAYILRQLARVRRLFLERTVVHHTVTI